MDMKTTNLTNKIRHIATAVIFAGILLFFGIGALISPDREYSVFERRKLEQMPVYAEYEDLAAYFSAWETYLTDQFLFRDELRFLKSGFAHGVLGQYDVNGYYSEGGSQAQILYPMNEENFTANIQLMEDLRQQYFSDSPVYYGVIPDKSYYMDAPLGLDYDKIHKWFGATLQARQIPLAENLTLSDYYATDIHWKQENLKGVYNAFATVMNPALPAWKFQVKSAGDFYGVLYGQAAMPAKKDQMNYLTNSAMDSYKVTLLNIGSDGKVTESEEKLYDPEAFAGDDAYDLYMGGEEPMLRIVNPNAATEKKLILFRDSFGRSIAPLLAEGYSEIILVDLRWIRSMALPLFADYLAADENTDVLFLYSAQVLNSMMLG